MNYTELAKVFLIYKLYEFDISNVKDNFDIVKLEEKIKESKNIEEIHTACKLIAKHGLKQITTLFLALKNFYEYLESRNDTLLSVDTDYLEDYINRYCINLNISFGYRSNYKINIVAFLNYIDKEIFFLKMINNYKKYIKKTFDKHQLLDLVNAIKFETNIKSIKIKYNNSDLVALKGEILLEMSNLEESMRNECFELISSIKFLGIGDRIEDGMGQVKVIE